MWLFTICSLRIAETANDKTPWWFYVFLAELTTSTLLCYLYSFSMSPPSHCDYRADIFNNEKLWNDEKTSRSWQNSEAPIMFPSYFVVSLSLIALRASASLTCLFAVLSELFFSDICSSLFFKRTRHKIHVSFEDIPVNLMLLPRQEETHVTARCWWLFSLVPKVSITTFWSGPFFIYYYILILCMFYYFHLRHHVFSNTKARVWGGGERRRPQRTL